MSQKKAKQARRLVKTVERLLENNYYILPRNILDVNKLPYYKEEFLNKLTKQLKEDL